LEVQGPVPKFEIEVRRPKSGFTHVLQVPQPGDVSITNEAGRVIAFTGAPFTDEKRTQVFEFA